MPRSAPRLLVLLLASAALCGCATMGALTGTPKDKDVAAKEKPLTAKAAAKDMDGNLRQAQLLRQAGSYDEAIHILSQLMLADADNPRVVAEYGKTLAQKGRAQDATQFLRRAIELTPNDWTLYSAMGVSFDQLGDQANARMAYEHALALHPEEAGVLNNYALSRMLAKDPDGAKLLIARAQAVGGADPKIARNVAMITGITADKTADAGKPVAVAAGKSNAAPKPVATAAAKPAETKLAAAPRSVTPPPAAPTAQNTSPQNNGPQSAGDVARLLASQSPVIAPATANAAPRQLAPQMAALQLQPAVPAPSGVVMQAVPYDPYAGPVVTLHKPKPKSVAKATAPKAETAKAADAPQKTAKADVVPSLRVANDKY